MERADVIILGGGLVGLTPRRRARPPRPCRIVVDPADPETRSRRLMTAAPPRSPARPGGCWRRSASPTGSRARLPDPRDPGQRRARTGRPPVRAEDEDDPLGIDGREPPAARCAARRGARGGADRPAHARAARPSRARRKRRRVALDDGRAVAAPLLVARRGTQLADARGGRTSGRALDATIMSRSSPRSPTSGRMANRLRDLLSRRPVRDPADAGGEDGQPRSAIVWSVQEARRPGDARPARPRACARDREKDGRLSGHGRRWPGRAGIIRSASTMPRRITDQAPRSGRRRRPRHPSDRRPGPQPRLPRRRGAGRGAGRGRAARPRSRRRRNCSTATNAGAASTPSWWRWRPTA